MKITAFWKIRTAVKTVADCFRSNVTYRVVQKTGLFLRVNNFQQGWDRKVNYMSFGKEISWEYANNNNFAYLLSSVVNSLEMKRFLIDCWTHRPIKRLAYLFIGLWLDSVNKSGHFEPSDWSAAEKTADAGP